MKKILYGIICLLLCVAFVNAWTPPSDADFRYYYGLYNVTEATIANLTVSDNLIASLSNEGDLNVNSSVYWDGETSQANLNVNSSDYWDNLNTLSDINAGDITNDGTYILSTDEGNLNVNSSDYWDSLNTQSDLTPSNFLTAGDFLSYATNTLNVDNSGILGSANDLDSNGNILENVVTDREINNVNASQVDNFDISAPNDYSYANIINMTDESVTYIDGRSLFAEEGSFGEVTIAGENITSGTVSSNYIEDAYLKNDGDTGTGNYVFTGGTLDADTLNTGQGDNELYAMNQDVQTTDSPTFAGGTILNNLTVGGQISRHALTSSLGIADKEYEWDNTNSDPAVTVEGSIDEYIQEVRVVTLADDGTVNSVCADYENQQIDCVTNGSDGQVMVEFPQLYYKETKDSNGNLVKVEISEFDLPGFKLHPAFSWGEGRNRDYVYIGAYEASYDGSALASVSGEPTRTGRIMAQYRDEAAARYTGNQSTSSWHPIGFWQRHMVELLWYGYYETRNSQESQPGYTEASSFNAAYKRNTGRSINCTTHNCSVTADLDGTDSDLSAVLNVGDKIANRFLWIENEFGHIWKFTDGVTYVPTETVGVSAGWDGDYQAVYTTADPRKFSSDNAEIYNNYEKLPVTPYGITGDDYISKVGAGFVPTDGGASSSTYWTDNYGSYLTDSDKAYLRSVRAGGPLGLGGRAGVASRSLGRALGDSDSYGGSRLCYSKI